MSALAKWAADHADAAAALAKRRDADGPMIDRALTRVRAFLAERRLIVFGGFAIDCALRLRGAAIYPDEERPDYDALSPTAIDDAYELADELFKAGFEQVDAIRAVHVQTMRVRVNYRPVADLGYMPADVCARVPTLIYKDLRVVHPDFQRIDMHLAFCFPYSGAPREDVFNRWQKDLKRYNLLGEHYPITPSEQAPQSAANTISAEFAVPIAGSIADLAVALTGFAGYAALRASLDSTARALGADAQARLARVQAPRLALTVAGTSITLELPKDAITEIALVAPAPISAIGPDSTEFEPYVDIYPSSYRKANATVLSSAGRLIAVTPVRLSDISIDASEQQKEGDSPTQSLYIATPQHILLYLLQWANRTDGAVREVYRTYYAHTLEVVKAAEDLFMDAFDADPKLVADLFEKSPFAPSVRTLGTINTDAAYVIKMAGYAARLHDRPPEVLGLESDIAGALKGLPLNYYPGRPGSSRPQFNYGDCPLYRRSGLVISD
jgi:hypothetical protein